MPLFSQLLQCLQSHSCLYCTIMPTTPYFQNNTNPENEFWNEFFLLQPNVEVLEQELVNQPFTASKIKRNVNELFTRCIEILESDNPKRVYNAIQTLAALIYGIFKKANAEAGSGFDIINTLIGFDSAEENMKTLVSFCNKFLTKSPENSINEGTEQEVADKISTNELIRDICLKLLLVLVTGTDNVSQNLLLEFFMINNCLFSSFVNILSDPVLRIRHGHDVVILLTLLVNYRKYESANPYIVQLSLLADELALNGYSQVISCALIDFCRQFASQNPMNDQQSATSNSSWFSSLSNIVGNMFVSDEGVEKFQQIRANNALLLALYEAIHLNRNFITTLAQTQAESTSTPPSPSNTLNHNQPAPDLKSAPAAIIIDVTQFPTNLLVAVFQYSSIIMQ